jgi:predicted metal-dependent enzyme (double-stranded beta helix superfamily)
MNHNKFRSTSDRSASVHAMTPAPVGEDLRALSALAETAATRQAHAFARLCNALDALLQPSSPSADDPSLRAAFALGIRTALTEAAADPALLTPTQREASIGSYRRHLLAADPHGRYAIAALVWLPGQASPVHAHQTWCGYVVLDGTLSETVYDWNAPLQRAIETRTHARASGAVSFARAGRKGIHRLGNASDAPAVSLHIYGVQESQIATHVNDVVKVATDAALLAEPAAIL